MLGGHTPVGGFILTPYQKMLNGGKRPQIQSGLSVTNLNLHAATSGDRRPTTGQTA